MNEALDEVAQLLRREAGIRLEPNQYPALRSALSRSPSGDARTFLRAVDDPVWGRDAIARLVDEVTIKETSFFRDRRQLDAIAWRLLLEHAHAAGSSEIRVWSAACATGEEPYTLALLASEAFAPAEPPVRILGTDISTQALETAVSGSYRERSMRAVEPGIRRRYFDERDGHFVVGSRIRRLVEFAPHNLARDPIPPVGEPAFDLIVCRNVLIYFDGETVERAVSGLERALRPAAGMLILGSADTLCGTVRRLERLTFGEGVTHARRPPMLKSLRRPLGRVPPSSEQGADILDPEQWFLKGVAALEVDDAAAAVSALRRALYLDATFGLAAFTLGRAHEAAGDPEAARRAYEHALRTIDLTDGRHDHLLEQVHLEDVATACRVRLSVLRSLGPKA